MSLGAGSSAAFDVVGTLERTELEDGGWQLRLEHDHEVLGTQVTLVDFVPPAGLGNGAAVTATLAPLAGQVGFTMAGVRTTVLAVAPA